MYIPYRNSSKRKLAFRSLSLKCNGCLNIKTVKRVKIQSNEKKGNKQTNKKNKKTNQKINKKQAKHMQKKRKKRKKTIQVEFCL